MGLYKRNDIMHKTETPTGFDKPLHHNAIEAARESLAKGEQPTLPPLLAYLEKFKILDEVCQCGVVRSLHADTVSYGHGQGPLVDQEELDHVEKCMRFNFAAFVVG